MFLIGYSRAMTGIIDETTGEVSEVIEIKGLANQGATKEFTISGLSAEGVKVYGSNSAYYISRKGIGDLKAEFSDLDVPLAHQTKLLGLKTHEAGGFVVGGKESEPPYCAKIFFSENGQGKPVAFALFKGVITRGEITGSTSEDTPVEPEAESYSMDCVVNEDGNGYGIAVGEEQVAALITYAFPGYTATV